MYKFNKDSYFEFIACGNTLPIDFCVDENGVAAKYNKISSNYSNALKHSHVAIISEIIKESINQEVSPDYNGNYVIHGNCKDFDYTLQLNEVGLPIKITSNNKELLVEFNDINEDNNET